jgi:copper chaperone CopZ
MERLTLDLPTMYGDHHVTEVRGLLSALPGVRPLYVSAAWQKVELEYDPAQTGPQLIRQALAARGYTADPVGVPPVSSRNKTLTEYAFGPGAVEQFVEKVPAWGAPSAPCPGFEIRHPGEVHPADR